ncbi:hypothetical protein [Bacillus cereus group sp. RP32]|uniref:hypothetical protein n=1 Tax=Bacillus cereus group sp. RP32 TaxID=3040258 RepID=UPI0033966112
MKNQLTDYIEKRDKLIKKDIINRKDHEKQLEKWAKNLIKMMSGIQGVKNKLTSFGTRSKFIVFFF